MPITRQPYHTDQTLEEFYSEEAASDSSIGMGNHMLSFIDLINRTFIETTIYASTSHYFLNLLAGKELHIHVTLITYSKYHFYIDYIMPKEKAPWPNARVIKQMSEIEDAIKYLVIAMHESEGWLGNKELESLYIKHVKPII